MTVASRRNHHGEDGGQAAGATMSMSGRMLLSLRGATATATTTGGAAPHGSRGARRAPMRSDIFATAAARNARRDTRALGGRGLQSFFADAPPGTDAAAAAAAADAPPVPPPRTHSAAAPRSAAAAAASRRAVPAQLRSDLLATERRGDMHVDWWVLTSRLLSCCFPPALIARWKAAGGKRGSKPPPITPQLVKDMAQGIQDWREKFASCVIIVIMMTGMAYVTVGLQWTFCSSPPDIYATSVLESNHKTLKYQNHVVIFGHVYDFNDTAKILSEKAKIALNSDYIGSDLTRLFSASACNQFGTQITACFVADKYGGPGISTDCLDRSIIYSNIKPSGLAYFSWDDVTENSQAPHTLTVYNGAVMNLTDYFLAPSNQTFGQSTKAINNIISSNLGLDATRALAASYSTIAAANCLTQRYVTGYVDQASAGCSANVFIQGTILAVIATMITVRFLMAFVFHWCISGSLTDAFEARHKRAFRRGRRLHAPSATTSSLPINQTALESGLNPTATAVWQNSRRQTDSPDDAYVVMLVTCYSEDADGIRKTVDSLACTDYPDKHKLLFVVADGLVQGSGQAEFTSDIVRGLVESVVDGDTEMQAKDYFAIADKMKQHNRAKVYAGFFTSSLGGKVPIVAIIKCGNPAESEQAPGKKPGNRGKRDSQMILMNFLAGVTIPDARMTPLDYDLATKIERIAGVDPSVYTLVLMVDADTAVDEESLFYMAQAMKNNPKIMGLCGETRIENKSQSWVTKIQVFEYYISHHLGKAFESVFGGVTCLPGCFSMYRAKSFEPFGWDEVVPQGQTHKTIPLLIDPEIMLNYKEFIVETLHKKNLLLLGEDRYLTTLMLSKFPARRMVFVPQARCETTVPDTFKMLLSQRRRWINSTIHNLLELMRIPDLCGVFCLSMKFVIMLELIGTVVLPIAVSLMFVLIISAFISGPSLALYTLLITLLLPAILILTTTMEYEYVAWMFVYLAALPIWNFVLPLYSFWNFDDVSWGETRKVEGEETAAGHGTSTEEYLAGAVLTRTWEQWRTQDLSFEQENLSYASIATHVHAVLENVANAEVRRASSRSNLTSRSVEQSRSNSRQSSPTEFHSASGQSGIRSSRQARGRSDSGVDDSNEDLNTPLLDQMLDHQFGPKTIEQPLAAHTSQIRQDQHYSLYGMHHPYYTHGSYANSYGGHVSAFQNDSQIHYYGSIPGSDGYGHTVSSFASSSQALLHQTPSQTTTQSHFITSSAPAVEILSVNRSISTQPNVFTASSHSAAHGDSFLSTDDDEQPLSNLRNDRTPKAKKSTRIGVIPGFTALSQDFDIETEESFNQDALAVSAKQNETFQESFFDSPGSDGHPNRKSEEKSAAGASIDDARDSSLSSQAEFFGGSIRGEKKRMGLVESAFGSIRSQFAKFLSSDTSAASSMQMKSTTKKQRPLLSAALYGGPASTSEPWAVSSSANQSYLATSRAGSIVSRGSEHLSSHRHQSRVPVPSERSRVSESDDSINVASKVSVFPGDGNRTSGAVKANRAQEVIETRSQVVANTNGSDSFASTEGVPNTLSVSAFRNSVSVDERAQGNIQNSTNRNSATGSFPVIIQQGSFTPVSDVDRSFVDSVGESDGRKNLNENVINQIAPETITRPTFLARTEAKDLRQNIHLPKNLSLASASVKNISLADTYSPSHASARSLVANASSSSYSSIYSEDFVSARESPRHMLMTKAWPSVANPQQVSSRYIDADSSIRAGQDPLDAANVSGMSDISSVENVSISIDESVIFGDSFLADSQTRNPFSDSKTPVPSRAPIPVYSTAKNVVGDGDSGGSRLTESNKTSFAGRKGQQAPNGDSNDSLVFEQSLLIPQATARKANDISHIGTQPISVKHNWTSTVSAQPTRREEISSLGDSSRLVHTSRSGIQASIAESEKRGRGPRPFPSHLSLK